MDLTIVIPFYEGHDTIRSLLASIPKELPVIIVDDVSEKPITLNRENTRIFRLKEKGYFSGAVNFGVQQCTTDVLVLNQDIEFKTREAFELIELYHQKYALIGESIAGTHPSWPTGYVHGSFMFMRRDAITAVGLLNAKDYPLWGSTCEWQLRICRKGFQALPVRPIPGMIHKRVGNYGSSIEKLLKIDPDRKAWFIRTPPMISVIVPAYNHARYLPELIHSLIGGLTALGDLPGQTFQSFDVIIADDCSTDNTVAVMKELEDPWKGIKYVRTSKNSGTSAACNIAIKSSNAKYIARIDADDMRDANSLEIMLRAQLLNNHSFVYDDVQLFSGSDKIPKIWRMSDYDFDQLIEKNFIHAGIMFPREAWKEVGGYPEEMRDGRDDWAFNIALGLKGWCGVHVSNPGYLYRRHGNNRTLRNTTPAHRAVFYQKIRSLYPEAYKEVRPMACCGGGGRRSGRSQTYQKGVGGNMPSMPGTQGLVLVEYQGHNDGTETYFGGATGSTYTFSARKNRRWVDPKDLHAETRGGQKVGLLDLTRNGKYLFKLYREPVNEAIQKAVAIATEMAVEVIPEDAVATPVEEKEEEVGEPADDFFSVIRGIGLTTSKRLIEHGYYSMHQLAVADTEVLMDQMGWSMDKTFDIQEQASRA